FSDLEEFSVRLLEENEEARERIRRQFDHVLMDEFQDTNGLQSKLLGLLRPADRFYAVGDINQSIYGFRHADPQVFDDYRSRLRSEGKQVAELRENWRSRGDILNAVLSRLLRVLANPRDEISLAAVLRSPLVGVSDKALFDMRQAGNLADADLGAFGRDLQSWRAARNNISADRLLMRAMDRSGYELSLGPRRRANIEKFLTLVREAGARLSLDELVEELQRLRESDPREQDSQAEESGDAVRILTIHAAKGL